MHNIKLIENDPYLKEFEVKIRQRLELAAQKKNEIAGTGSLSEFANGHNYFGCQKSSDKWIFREWAPNATGIQLVGDRMGWNNTNHEYSFTKISDDIWQLEIDFLKLQHLDQYKLLVSWQGGQDLRLSPWTKRVIQDPNTKLFSEQVWDPESKYSFVNAKKSFSTDKTLLIYEAHIGMSSNEEKVSSYIEFRKNVLPYIANLGYNVIQLMAIQEHPYYGSFGYHVSNFFAPSSRFGTPDELKELIDAAHKLGIAVIMDIVHSHAVKNILEGPGSFDGSEGMFFHTDQRRVHPAWDSLCFDYGKNETLHFLLSNCKYWLEEFCFDGFRFDGVTSMLYYDHGLERSFDTYSSYFNEGIDTDASTYLFLANQLIKEVNPNSIVIAEDMSGMPGLAATRPDGGYGFDFRLAMGVPDFWIKMIKEKTDEEWSVNQIFYELTNRRKDEKVISYSESHDQALVGDKTIMFRLADQEMYSHMSINTPSLLIDRALSLHKLIRLITLCTHGGGYLNFMGNEFGHPEWVDFPREGNDWSFTYARRQWQLLNNNTLRYRQLGEFDHAIIQLFNNNALVNDPEYVFANEDDQVIAIKREDYLFIFNFNPTKSFPDYGIPCFPADYELIISSDEKIFGGFDRVKSSIVLESQPIQSVTGSKYQLMTYLPSRTALITKMIPTPKIR